MNDDMNKRREFDEVSSAMAFENKAYANGTVGEIRYLHSWWREGAKWQFAEMQAQVDVLAAFINKWLDFEDSCIKKDGPYVNLPIPKLMSEAREALAEIQKMRGSPTTTKLNGES